MSDDVFSEREMLELYGTPKFNRLETLRRVRAWKLSRRRNYRIVLVPESRLFIVPSKSRAGVLWDVIIDQQQRMQCLCPDFKARGMCIHCGVVLYRFFPSFAPEPPSPEMLSAFKKRTHYENARRSPKKPFIYREGPAESTRYDQALVGQDQRIEELLKDLASVLDCGWVPTRAGPRLSPGQIVSVLVMRQHHRKSMRKTRDMLQRSTFNDLRILPTKNTIITYMQSPETTRLLQRAFAMTLAPFRLMEQDIIVDSSGFSPRFFESWLVVGFDESSRAGTRWFKVHIAKGRISQAILAFTLTPCDGDTSADIVNLMPLVSAVIASGFDPRFVVADNIYLTRELIEAVAGVGARLIGPLKPRNIGRNGEGYDSIRPIWDFAQAYPELYDELIRDRQPIEAVFSLMKREDGRVASIGTSEERQLEKDGDHDGLFVSTINEMWIRIILYNLRRINLQERLRNRRISFAKGSVFSHVREIVDDEAA